jgi:hypothetical protein
MGTHERKEVFEDAADRRKLKHPSRVDILQYAQSCIEVLPESTCQQTVGRLRLNPILTGLRESPSPIVVENVAVESSSFNKVQEADLLSD